MLLRIHLLPRGKLYHRSTRFRQIFKVTYPLLCNILGKRLPKIAPVMGAHSLMASPPSRKFLFSLYSAGIFQTLILRIAFSFTLHGEGILSVPGYKTLVVMGLGEASSLLCR